MVGHVISNVLKIFIQNLCFTDLVACLFIHRRASDMARSSSKHASLKLVLICLALLGFALIADYMWASSSRFSYSLSIASNWAPPYHSHSSITLPTNPHPANLTKVSSSSFSFPIGFKPGFVSRMKPSKILDVDLCFFCGWA